jgi:hypothetical protein
LEDLFAAVASMPWWAGAAAAIVAYFGLHQLATQTVTVTTQPGQIGSYAVRTIGVADRRAESTR